MDKTIYSRPNVQISHVLLFTSATRMQNKMKKTHSTTETLITYITSKLGHESLKKKKKKKLVKVVSWICTLQTGLVTPFYKSKW